VADFPGSTNVFASDVLEAECDILIPAAVQSVIHAGNAAKVKAKLVIECANGPVTPDGEEILIGKGVTLLPDVLCNVGSAIVCGFERTQCLTDEYWDRETVRSRLEQRILKAFKETVATAEEMKIGYREGAWVNALRRIERAMEARGWL
jgi:glutamate dehydrogenase/leucine dehydrogenase